MTSSIHLWGFLEPALTRSVPSTMFTAFRCYSGECITEDGLPVALLLSNQPLGQHRSLQVIRRPCLKDVWCWHQWKYMEIYYVSSLIPLDLYGLFWSRFGWFFVLLYVAGYMLVTMGPLVALGAARLPMWVSRKRLWRLCFFIRNGCLCHKHMIRMKCSPLLWLMMTWLRIHHSKLCHFIRPPPGQFWWCVAWFPSPFHPEEFSMSFLPFMRLGMHLITCLPFFANLRFSPCGAENFGPWGGYHHEGTAVGTDAMGGLQHH